MKNGWQKKTLAEVCEVDKSQGIYKSLPYVGLEHIESHTGRFLGSIEPFEVKSSTFKFSPEHVLYGRLRPYLNKVMLPDFTGHCSTEIFPLKPHRELTREFLQYWFLRDATVEQINATSTGARMPRANIREVLEFEFPLPPLPEQRRIIAILDEAFDGIATAKANAEMNLRNARALFESYLHAVFTQRGKGWVVKRLDEVARAIAPSQGTRLAWPFHSGDAREKTGEAGQSDIGMSLTKNRLVFLTPCRSASSRCDCPDEVADANCTLSYGIVQPGDEYIEGMPVVRPTDLTRKVIRLSGLKRIDPKLAERYKRTTLHGGELLLCVRGSTGIVSIASLELIGANVTRGIVPIRFDRSLVMPEFGFYLINSGPVQDQIREKTYGAALMQINIWDLRNIALCIPPLKEQKEIAAKLDDLREETQRLESLYQRKLAALDELKKSLLHQAFSGEL